MNRKIVITCTILAVLLLGGIGFGFYKLFFSSDQMDTQMADMRGDAIKAVPADAVMVYDFASFDDVKGVCADGSGFSDFINGESQLVKFIKMCSQVKSDDGAILSLHYSAKNTVSFLFVLSVENQEDREDLKEHLADFCSGVINKKYSGITISKAVIPGISYSFYNNYLITSTSHVTVESSIRHLESKTSILDNPLYSSMAKSVGGKVILHINHQNIGKLFSGAVNYGYLGRATFFSSFASWSSFTIDPMGSAFYCDGKLLSTAGVGNFSNVFSLQKSRSTDVLDILPHNTEYVITMPLYSPEAYLESYVSYLEAIKKMKDYSYLNSVAPERIGETISPKQWFLDMEVEEIAVASIPDEKGGERVVMMKVEDPSGMKLYKGYLKTLLGRLFTPTTEESFSVIGKWVVVGSERMVEKMAAQVENELFFSLEMYLNQTPAASICKDQISALGVVNLSRCADSLGKYFKEEYSRELVGGVDENNFNYLTFSLVNDGKGVIPHVKWYFEDLEVLPQPPVAEISTSSAAVYDDAVLEVPQGPFPVKNFINGKGNYLQQLDDDKLRLLDENKRGVWTVPFEGRLCGFVEQVDHYKNNKLQMLFCSGNRLCMLDRLGRWVKSYPLQLPKGVALGPKVYDFEGNRSYTLMVLHTDNTIGMYDIGGRAISSWTSLAISEKIVSMPEMLEMGGERYWVVRTGYQTIICNSAGAPVADFTKKRKLISDTKVEKRSDREVVVTAVDGRDMVLNLQTGVMKKL